MQEKQILSFQAAVDEYLIRHRSILDIMTKYQESAARVNRALAKAVTECGCVTVRAERQQVPSTTAYRDLKNFMQTHVEGEPCANCKEILTKEIGHHLFYLAALCNATHVDLLEVMDEECRNVKTLGLYHLT